MLITLVALAVIGAAQAQTPPVTPEARRNPNVCADVPATDITQFKNDYSACEAYFWCDGPQARPTTPCRDGFNFDEANLACDQAFVCLPCPATGTIAVGVQSDTTCRTYSFCVGGTRSTEVETCGAGTRFNRDTGLCDLEANVVCVGPGGGSGGTASCTDPVTGDPITGDVKSPAGCNRFVFCNAGVEDTTLGIMSCGALHFNPVTRACDLPANLVPLCVDPATSAESRLPTVKHVTTPPSFKDRFMRKLHLKH